MPLLLVIFLFACVIGIVLALITLSLQRISGRALKQFKARLNDADTIVNQGQVPESWIHPFRQRLEEVRPASVVLRATAGRDKDERAVARIEERAKKHCLKKLRSLIEFMENGQFYDSVETRETVLKTLKTQHDEWASSDWRALVQREP